MALAASVREYLGFMRGNIRVLTATRVLGQFARSLAFPYASLYILALGGRPAQIGLVNSLAPLAGLLAFPIAGYLSDHAGPPPTDRVARRCGGCAPAARSRSDE